VYKVNDRVVIKTGPSVQRSEACTLQELGKWGVPVPKVFDHYYNASMGGYCIVMEYIAGLPLDQVVDSFNGREMESVILDLGNHLHRLRQITAPSRCIQSLDRSIVRDRFFSNPKYAGPYNTEEEFVDGIIRSLRARGDDDWTELVVRLLQGLPNRGDRYVLTHGELSPRNILMRGTEVVTILDWSQAGYYPVYWEFVKACLWDHRWLAVAARILTPFMHELSVMIHAHNIIW
jgi:aminoglycoside phosphotransferase (APT) family kinase protein